MKRAAEANPEAERDAIPLARALPVWIRIALLSFGGPAGQISVMHRILVEERKWVKEERFLHCMSYCMLLPGPEAQQLATYLGWLLHGTRGGLIAGILFILPGFLSILLLSILYAEFQQTTILAGIFFGLKPAVMAVVLDALMRIGRRALIGRAHMLLAAAAFIAIFFLDVPFPIIIVAAGLLGYLGSRLPQPDADAVPERSAHAIGRPSTRATLQTAAFWLLLWLAPIGLLIGLFGHESVFVEEAYFFSKTAIVTFGGAYAVLSYIAQQAVEVHAWLNPGEMLDGLGMAETTPGPLIQVVQFVGYLGAYRNPGALSPVAAGVLGSVVTAWATFVPCFMFIFVGAPFAEHLRGRPGLKAALSGITAAIVGVILNLAVWFSLHTLFADVAERRAGPLRVLVPDWGTIDWASLVLAVAALVAMLRFRVGMMTTLAVAAAIGLVFSLVFR